MCAGMAATPSSQGAASIVFLINNSTPLCLSSCAVVLEKFKDKAAVVGKAAAEALDAMARYSFSLVDVAEVGSTMVQLCRKWHHVQ